MGKKKDDALKKQLLNTVEGLRAEDIDLGETPALFTWSYEEEPWIEFQLLIKEVDKANLPLEEGLPH